MHCELKNLGVVNEAVPHGLSSLRDLQDGNGNVEIAIGEVYLVKVAAMKAAERR